MNVELKKRKKKEKAIVRTYRSIFFPPLSFLSFSFPSPFFIAPFSSPEFQKYRPPPWNMNKLEM